MLYPDFNELLALKKQASLLRLSTNHKVSSSSMGSHNSPFKGQGLEFEEVRTYTAGDDIRNIDWRVTARTNIPHTKLFREERERSVMICVDQNQEMRFGTKVTFKSIQAARIATLLAWHTSSLNDRVGACLFGDLLGGIEYIRPSKSKKSLLKMMKALCSRAEFKNATGKVALSETFKYLAQATSSGSLVFIISDFAYELNDSFRENLFALKKRADVVFISVNDPADGYIPQIGSFIASDTVNSSSINTDNPESHERYARQWRTHQDSLENITKQLKIKRIEISTDRDFFSDLHLGLQHVGIKSTRI